VKRASLIVVLLCGALFGFGLSLAGMIKPEVVLSFLEWRDFGLLLVLGGAATVAMIAYQLAPRLLKKPVLAEKFGVHPSALNRDTIVGAAIFGAGWGLSGVCPGPSIAAIGAGNWPVLWALCGIVIGAWIQGTQKS
jgi:uncharacterized membrane protein YedE/YeeE